MPGPAGYVRLFRNKTDTGGTTVEFVILVVGLGEPVVVPHGIGQKGRWMQGKRHSLLHVGRRLGFFAPKQCPTPLLAVPALTAVIPLTLPNNGN